MRDISQKTKFTKDFCWNDESWDWQGMEDQSRYRMIKKKIEIFGPRIMSDYISVPNIGAVTKDAKDDDTDD
jgi:hypothetical protein